MNYNALMSAIRLMWQGMSAIFIVMILILVIVYLFTTFFTKKTED